MIEKEKYDIVSKLKCGGAKYTLLREKTPEEGLDFYGKGYRVVDAAGRPVDCRFWDCQIKERGCETPFEYIKTEGFYYGLLQNAVECECEELDDTEKEPASHAPYAYYYEEKQRERESRIFD